MPRTIFGSYLALAGSTTEIPQVVDAVTMTSPDGVVVWRWATAAITYRSSTYQPRLRRVSGLNMSLNGGFGRVTFSLTNADLAESKRVARKPDNYIGYRISYIKILTGKVSGSTVSADVSMLAGIVTGYKMDESGIEFDVVTSASRSPVLSNRRVGVKCPWVFKGTECGYSGGLTTCNKLYSDSGGCSGRSNQHRFGGFPSRPDIATIGAVSGLGAAPAYQIIRSDSTAFKQQTQLRFNGATIINDDASASTVITALSGSTIQGVINNIFNVKDATYGAIGNGVANDTAAIQAAIDAAQAADGGLVYLPAGTYRITSTLDFGPREITLVGAGPGASIIQMATSNIPIIEITGYSANTLRIESLTIQGPGPTTGTSGHGIYVHDNNYEIYCFWIDNVQILDCGGHGIYVTAHFTNEYSRVFVSNCGLNAFDLRGNNTIKLRSCYADDINNNGVGYRVHAGQLFMDNCNGLDSLGAVSDWAVFGDAITDGDAGNSYCRATLTNCNIESFKRYGVRCKVGSVVTLNSCSFVTSSSGSAHMAVKMDYTGDSPGTLTTCRFDVQGTGTWANGYPLHGFDRPVLLLGNRSSGADGTAPHTKYWNDSGGVAGRLPAASVEFFLSQPLNVKSDYGCLGDDSDETTKIQAAINDAQAAGGGVVYFPKGTYRVTGLTVSGRVYLVGETMHQSTIKSVTNAPIVDCTASSSWMPRIRNLRIYGSGSGGSQIGLRVDDAVYGAYAEVLDVLIENCGSAGLYIGNAFSSHFERVYSTDNAGGNYIINAGNMPALTLAHCDSGVVHSSYRTGYHIKAGNVILRDCNSVYGGTNPEWCVTIGRRIGRYGETVANGSASVRFEGCNFESSTVGGVECLFNSRASFQACTWAGAAGSSGSYKAVLYDVCQYNPTETTGSITSGTATLTVANAATWTTGQGIRVVGAGTAGADLTTTVSTIAGTTFTLAANAGTTVTNAVVSHTDDIFYAVTQAKLGMVDDDSSFSQSPASYYANSEPIHITSYPTTAASASIPPLAVNGRGPRIAGDKFVSAFRNDSTSVIRPLPRMDGFMPVQTITASTSYDGPGVRYIECNHTSPVTITLPWPGWMLNTANEPIIIKDRSSSGASVNSITIQANSGGSINGNATYTINADKGAVILMPRSDNDYRVIAAYAGGNVEPQADASTDLGRSSLRFRDARLSRDLYLGRQMQTAGSALTSTTSTGAGTSPTVTVAGTAVAGSITLTTGTSPATGAMIVELTVPAAFTGYPVVMLTPANAAAAALSGNKQVFVDNAAATTTKWSIKSGSTALDASTAYIWYFHVIGV